MITYTTADKDGFSTSGPMSFEQAREFLAKQKAIGRERFVWEAKFDEQTHTLKPIRKVK